MTSPELRFYAEYQCYPTWVSLPGGGVDNPDPHTLGMPDDLARELVVWSDDYDALFDENDFNAPLFDSKATQQSFETRGRQLAERVAEAVGDRFAVRYHGLDDRTWIDLS